MARAKKMGFHTDMPLYHGTASEITSFDPALGGGTSGSLAAREGVFAARDPAVANRFAEIAQSKTGSGANVLPLFHRAQRLDQLTLRGDEMDHEVAATLQDAFDNGYDAVMLKNYTMGGSGKPSDIIVSTGSG